MTEDTEDFSPGEELSLAEWVAAWRLPWTRLTGPLPAATAAGSRCAENLNLLSPENLEALTDYAGAEGGGGAAQHPFRNCVLVISAKFPGRGDYRIRCRMESLVKGPRAGRSVDGAFDDPSGYGNRRCRHPESTGPEPTRLLHVKLLSHGQQGTTLSARKYKTAGILSFPHPSRSDGPSGGTTPSWGDRSCERPPVPGRDPGQLP